MNSENKEWDTSAMSTLLLLYNRFVLEDSVTNSPFICEFICLNQIFQWNFTKTKRMLMIEMKKITGRTNVLQCSQANPMAEI